MSPISLSHTHKVSLALSLSRCLKLPLTHTRSLRGSHTLSFFNSFSCIFLLPLPLPLFWRFMCVSLSPPHSLSPSLSLSVKRIKCNIANTPNATVSPPITFCLCLSFSLFTNLCRKALYICKRALNFCKRALHIRERALYIRKRAPYIAKEPCMSAKEPCISVTEPYISVKEPCICGQEQRSGDTHVNE